MDHMNCVEITARLHLYLDRELGQDEVEVVQQHFGACPSCEHRFHFDLSLKRLIHEKCTIEHAPAHLREAVMRIARTPLGEPIDIDPELAQEIKADLNG
ncbi:MAG: mycothiol system anti-sigma-R factor [Ktedonobacteraceae bacterium]|jgi:mycothiol system anti-sigma-R factor|nr:mycothiol system anti-sigma-R factor [Ktedonobacteraceae bacterium]MBO0792739.1 mycothiol system anti-sigma-R factor [Ktedonobacteraceae bacterium]